MYKEILMLVGQGSVNKINFMKSGIGKYLVASGLAGAYVGIGVILIMVIGSTAQIAGSPYGRIYMGLGFGIALSLVIMSGSELFTGNNLVHIMGILDKKITLFDGSKSWGYSYVGNFIGSIVIGTLFYMTGIEGSAVGDFVLQVSEVKMNGSFIELFFKGILCNILVCLAVLSSIKLKSESGKLIMIFWCLFAFIATGMEHSIANMTIFTIGLWLEHPETVSILGVFKNLIPVTLGNFVGGGLILGGSYYFMGREKIKG
ncbi:MAG: nitrite transporter NirC [Firmicutes bacterium HGW-Firmicutes-2]|jgi:nitrite transporter NirC|nr:MAG: nitrite transporter NirC [Firmicutes bacterium HGW-Firmicutes-2]